MSETGLDCGVDVAQPDVVLLNYADGSHFEYCEPCGAARVKDIGPDLFLKLETHGDRVRLAWTGLKEVTMPGHTKH